MDDGWLRQPHLARVRLSALWGWVELHTQRVGALMVMGRRALEGFLMIRAGIRQATSNANKIVY